MQNWKLVRQSSSASAHTNRQMWKFASAVARHAASPAAHRVSPSAIRRHARTSALWLLLQFFRHVCFVAGAEERHVASRDTHFDAQLVPALPAKHLAKAVWKSAEQVAGVVRQLPNCCLA